MLSYVIMICVSYPPPQDYVMVACFILLLTLEFVTGLGKIQYNDSIPLIFDFTNFSKEIYIVINIFVNQ